MKTKYLIADSAAFIRHCNLKELSETVYTCEEVVGEIKDSATKQRLQVLPYELKFKSPGPKFFNKVVEIAKITGDYASLSVTDLKVLALTYQLQCEFDCDPIEDVDAKNIVKKDQIQVGGGSVKEDLKIPGFYIPSSNNKKKNIDVQNENGDEHDDGNKQITQEDIEKFEESLVLSSENEGVSVGDENGDDWITPSNLDEIEEDENDDGWITPAKLAEMEESRLKEEKDTVKVVACLTTDFSMQNVLFKMKLNVISVDGLLIKNVRSYLLRCYGCFKTTSKMNKKFCPTCGHDTLKRVPIQVQDDGSIKMFFSRNPKVLSKRGKKYSLPTPKGGKHSMNPILCEDQRIPHNFAPKKSLMKTDVWNESYDTNSSPFASNDVYSRAFRVGVSRSNKPGTRRNRNPNAVNQKFVKRK